MRFLRLLVPSALAFLTCPGLPGQEVVSARSGMVHFTEGQVFLDDHQLDRKSGSFPGIKEGSTLRTEKGRAEVLLTPGTFLRLDENSSIRMVSTELADTRLVFLSGSAIFDLTDAHANNAITVTYKEARARFPKKGVYRLDGDTGVLQAYSGEATVDYAGKQTQLDPSHLFFCWLGLQTNKLGDGTEDEFYDWASDRNQVIADQNQLAQQTGHDPGDADMDPSAQLGAGAVPYLGAPGWVPPSISSQTYPVPSYRTSPYPYTTYSMGSTFYNPFPTLAPTPYIPFGYPLVVVTRPYRMHSQWPHPGNHPTWHPVTAGSALLPTPSPVRIGIPAPVGGFHPVAPHAGVSTLARPGMSVGAHPVGPRVAVHR